MEYLNYYYMYCKSPHSQVEVVVQSVAALKTEIVARFDKLEAMLLEGSRP